MAISLDQILNFTIPAIVFLFLAYVVIKPFREPLLKLWNVIKGWKEGREEKESDFETITTKSIIYE